jgi:hypothetical protein
MYIRGYDCSWILPFEYQISAATLYANLSRRD